MTLTGLTQKDDPEVKPRDLQSYPRLRFINTPVSHDASAGATYAKNVGTIPSPPDLGHFHIRTSPIIPKGTFFPALGKPTFSLKYKAAH